MCKDNQNPSNSSDENILIISHTALSTFDSMGSTLANYLSSYSEENIFQFYLKKMTPNIFLKSHYYCWTDYEVLKNIINPFNKSHKGCEIKPNESVDVNPASKDERGTGGWRKRGRNLFFRNILWTISFAFNKRIKEWVKSINLKAIVLMPGDFSFLFKLARKIAKKNGAPIILMQCESYLLKPNLSHGLFYLLYRNNFKINYKKTEKFVKSNIYLCQKLCDNYTSIFPNSKHITIYKPFVKPNNVDTHFTREKNSFIYAGNIGKMTGRYEILNDVCDEINKNGFVIDIYTNSTGEYLNDIINNSSVRFHPLISYNQLVNEYKKHEYVLYVENFKPNFVEDLKYGFSTKICDMLGYGCIGVTIGDSSIAGIQYLKENMIGYIFDDKEKIDLSSLKNVSDAEKQRMINRSKELLDKNHNSYKNSNSFRNEIIFAMKN